MTGCAVVFAQLGTVLTWSMKSDAIVPEVVTFTLRTGVRTIRLAAHTYMDSGRLL